MHPMLYKLPAKARGLGNNVYWTEFWRTFRNKHLRREPYCRYCAQLGEHTKATYVDHVKPHEGNPDLFFDENNLQSLCKTHHNVTKQSEEVRQQQRGCNLWGEPNDPEHHWHGGDPIAKPFRYNTERTGGRRRGQGPR